MVVRLRLFLASTSMLAIPTYESLRNSKHELLGLIIKEERPAGRGQETRENDLARTLKEDGVAVYRVRDHDDLRRLLSDFEVDVVIAISFGMLVKPDSLNLPKHGWINLHFSLLPKYRGAAPVQRAILAGEEVTGLSVFKLDEGMDTGPIFRSKKVSIAGRNAGEVLSSLSREGAGEIIAALDLIADGKAPISQSGEPSFAPKIQSSESRIDFADSSISIAQRVAAFAPTPGAWCEVQGRRIKIFSAEPTSDESEIPGICRSVDPLVVSCGRGALQIFEVQEAGKRRMTSQEWVRGARIEVGTKFS